MPPTPASRRFAAAALAIGLATMSTTGCSPAPEPARAYHLLPLLEAAQDSATVGTRVTRMELNSVVMTGWIQGNESFAVPIRLPERPRLLVSTAVLAPEPGGTFEIVVRTEGREETVFRREDPTPSTWIPASIDLQSFAGLETEIVFRTEGESAHLWGDPVVVQEGPPPPAVVVYVIDTLRADLLDAWGCPEGTSPSISRTVRNGVLFAECYSTSSWTRPAMGSVMTSRSAPSHGATLRTLAIHPELPTFAEVMQDAGYYTVALITNPQAGRPGGLDRGYDLVLEPPYLFQEFQRGAGREVSDVEYTGSSGTAAWVHHWLAANLDDFAGLPLFLYLHTNDPHAPYAPRRPFARLPLGGARDIPAELRGDFEKYSRDVRVADHDLGRTLRVLESAGLLDEGVLVLLADHGEEFGERGEHGHGQNLCPPETRVPFLLRAPKHVSGGRVVRARISLLDVQPTILDLLGMPAVEGHEGRALLSPTGPPEDERSLYFHMIEQARRTDASTLADSVLTAEIAILQGPWRLVLTKLPRGGLPAGRALYDLRADPGERRDVSEEHPEVADRLERELLAWYETGEGAGREKQTRGPALDPQTEEHLRALGYVD